MHYNLLLQRYDQSTISIILNEMNRPIRGVDYRIVTRIYDSRWRDLPRTRLSANGRTQRELKY